jgi:hypothetical protein
MMSDINRIVRPCEGAPVNRDDAISAIAAQPFDADIRVNLIGRYVDITFVRYDPARGAIVLDLDPEDVDCVLRSFFRARPAD